MDASSPLAGALAQAPSSLRGTLGKIAQIRLTPLGLRFQVPYHWAGRLDLGASAVLIEVKTDQGLVGIAEAAPDFDVSAVLGLLQSAAPQFVGQSPFAMQECLALARLRGGLSSSPRLGNVALAGLEMALWDAIGKAAGAPVYELFGGACRETVDYFGFLQGDTAEELVADAQRMVVAGYTVIYMKVGRGEALDLANVAAVREVIGDRCLRLDANEAWDTYSAIRMIKKLEPFDPDWIEQPTPAHSLAALRQVKEAVSVALAADQAAYTTNDVYEICRQRAADAIVISPHEAGGLLAFRKVAAIAEAAGVPLCLHGRFVTGITDLIQHHAALTLRNLTDGNQIMHQLLVRDIVARPDLTPQAGKLGLVEGPGFGFELDWDAVGQAAEIYREALSRDR
jgi:muconate cycloisomerase